MTRLQKAIERVPAFRISDFTWTGTVGVAELSSLHTLCPWAQIYEDAADLGFTVIGKRVSKLFTLKEEKRDSDRDVIAWIFTSLDGIFEIHILND